MEIPELGRRVKVILDGDSAKLKHWRGFRAYSPRATQISKISSTPKTTP
jgi:hypothetical protein